MCSAVQIGRKIMGLFGALTTSVTGLRAQSYALENISGNIANSQTIGFKRIDTSFQDLIPEDLPSRQKSGRPRRRLSAAATVRSTSASLTRGVPPGAYFSRYRAVWKKNGKERRKLREY